MRFRLACALALSVSTAFGQSDVVGASTLRRFDPSLNGAGVLAAQVEVSCPGWQVNPAVALMGGCQMTWTCGTGSETNFPNTLGTESGHANEVGRLFFSVAPGLARLDNYEVSHFANYIVPNQLPVSARIINQSFTYFARNNRVDREYDNYAAKYQVLFVSGAGNEGWVRSPGTAYNSISVGAHGGASSVGPATDGRCKPDITAPASATSFSTPLVAGAAALLMQAGASDIRLLKALLLNGAEKPAGWTNAPGAPLDARHGAGIVNAFNSWRQFRSGQHASDSAALARRGWDIASISSNQVRQYGLDVRGSNLTATLVWLRNYGCTNISNLDLALRSEVGELIAVSTSTLDNVEHLHVSSLPPGRYVLEVLSNDSDTYALAFDSGPSTPPQLAPWSLTGEPHQTYLIETTLDLRTWTPFLTNRTSEAGVFTFAPPLDAPARFFRALELP